jgi:hypothetical protein
LVALTLLKMKTVKKAMVQVKLVSCSIMLMVFLTFVMLMDSNLSESEILGARENGLVSSLMKMKHGMTTKD